MALIHCQECYARVSDHARKCHKCGAPVAASVNRRKKAALIGLGIRLAFTVLVVTASWVVIHRLGHDAFGPLKAIDQQQSSPR